MRVRRTVNKLVVVPEARPKPLGTQLTVPYVDPTKSPLEAVAEVPSAVPPGVRLGRIAKEFRWSLDHVAHALARQGHRVDPYPYVRISEEEYERLIIAHAADLHVEDRHMIHEPVRPHEVTKPRFSPADFLPLLNSEPVVAEWPFTPNGGSGTVTFWSGFLTWWPERWERSHQVSSYLAFLFGVCAAYLTTVCLTYVWFINETAAMHLADAVYLVSAAFFLFLFLSRLREWRSAGSSSLTVPLRTVPA